MIEEQLAHDLIVGFGLIALIIGTCGSVFLQMVSNRNWDKNFIINIFISSVLVFMLSQIVTQEPSASINEIGLAEVLFIIFILLFALTSPYMIWKLYQRGKAGCPSVVPKRDRENSSCELSDE